MATLRLGTRGSPLALYQANAVADLLRARSGATCEIVVIRTSGDRLADATLAQVGGKRLFVKEIEDALAAGTIDLAVHSSKDMPAALPDGLAIGAVLPREDARDAVVLPDGGAGGDGARRVPMSLSDLQARLGTTPRIGTSSIRRTAQLVRLFPGARFEPIRGNLDTRLRKLDTGTSDALVLAAAGLKRLGYERRISVMLPPGICVPAPGQGIIAVEIRIADRAVRAAIEPIDDAPSAAALAAERMVVSRLGGGCQMPIGAHAAVSSGGLSLSAIVVSLDGARAIRAESSGALSDADGVGARAADRLLAQGAAEILAEADQPRAAVEGLQS
ncbi:MAG: hydroxymethylbilane synthase [Acidobacteria bacterium]|nr:hydroxymethylbilane synthase [Acidobacteriota bacterium]